MTLLQILSLRATGGTEVQTDYFETVVGLRPCSNSHPPSLKNPTPVKVPMSQDGWHKGDSKAARKQAKEDLLRLLQQSQRQIGVPQGGTTAQYPVFPSVDRWT